MPETVTIHLEKPIASAKLVNGAAVEATAVSAEAKQAELLKLQNESMTQAYRALQDAINKLNEFQENIFKEHKEQIAKLSVEIARKVLAQNVEKGNYQIESIVQEALKNAPTRQDMVVHLNPEDLAQCQKIQQEDTAGTLADIKLVSDPKIGRAECLLETPKGIIECFIAEQLERVAKALENAE